MAASCVACGRPAQVTITLAYDGDADAIATCRACVGAVLLDLADTLAPGPVRVEVDPDQLQLPL